MKIQKFLCIECLPSQLVFQSQSCSINLFSGRISVLQVSAVDVQIHLQILDQFCQEIQNNNNNNDNNYNDKNDNNKDLALKTF